MPTPAALKTNEQLWLYSSYRSPTSALRSALGFSAHCVKIERHSVVKQATALPYGCKGGILNQIFSGGYFNIKSIFNFYPA